MPVNDHLEWVEIKDFTKGLWNVNSGFLAPAQYMTVLTDAEPQPGGGVRPFWAPVAIATTGLGSATAERLQDIYSFIASDANTYWMLTTHNPSTHVGKAYIASGTTPPTSWTLSKTFHALASGTSGGGQLPISHYDTAGTAYYFVLQTLNDAGSAVESWLYNPVTATWSETGSILTGPSINYQGRLVVAFLGDLYWTDIGGTTFPAPNFLKLYQGSEDFRGAISALVRLAPSQLIVATTKDVWWSIEGDITDPVVREMGSRALPGVGVVMARDDDGIMFYEPGGGTWHSGNSGSTFDLMDPHLDKVSVFGLTNQPFQTPLFGVAVAGPYAFVPGGYVYSYVTKSWFRLSQEDASKPLLHFTKISDDTVIGLQYGSSGAIYQWQFQDFGISTEPARATSMTIKTAPVRNTKGRWMHIREVQVAYQALGAASTIAVTVNGVTQTSATLAAGTGELSFLFDAQGRYLDVQIVSASNSTSEAPTIEALRIGSRPDAHQVR